jgi:hypothetical protein
MLPECWLKSDKTWPPNKLMPMPNTLDKNKNVPTPLPLWTEPLLITPTKKTKLKTKLPS